MSLVNRFLTSYEALYQIAEALSSGDHLDEANNAADATQALAVQTAQKMAAVLDQHLYGSGPAEQTLLDELRYALTALADEMLLFQISWPGQGYWCDHLLEEKLFGTSVAGRVIFQRIKTLGKRRDNAKDKDQLASIYLMLLQLGFYGECRHQRERLSEYRVILNRLRFHPELPTRAFVQAYEHLLSGAYPQTLGAMSRWWRWVGLAAGAYLILALIIWLSAVHIFVGIYDAQLTSVPKLGAGVVNDQQSPVDTAAPIKKLIGQLDRDAKFVQRQGAL